ncbi:MULTISPECIES: AP endonuclease [unclassified Kitasatospora]|uniref:AP endonuclease n=1 Tax=unclassified Kitasatospora TaxID=2633591 RepID=UPI001AE0E479|nr:AP endonuclease [Kitasatospora sp. RG8]MBP0451133.1 AP endonuclease [Kitasatospora sp. RG8]
MTRQGRPPLGLYSIGVRHLPPEQLLPWAAAQAVPFVHLRGGPRGHHLSERAPAELAAWRALADRTVPVTAVTADLELAALLADDPAALAELDALAERGGSLGARAVRVLATDPPESWSRSASARLRGRPLLIEPHSPDWFTPEALDFTDRLLDLLPEAALLADSLQFDRCAPAPDRALADRLVARAAAVHLSDRGDGFAAPGHRLLLQAARDAAARGAQIELAFEWTGADRSPATCLARYRQAITWLGDTW